MPKKNALNIKYETSHHDEWGNLFVICPVCGFSFSRDGVMKHIVRSAQVGEETHKKWLEEERRTLKNNK